MSEMYSSPRERARQNREATEAAFGREGKRPLSVERAQKIFNEQLDHAHSYVIRERKRKAMSAYEARVAGPIAENQRGLIVKAALDAMKRVNSGEYAEREAIRREADLLVRYDQYDFADAMSMIGSVVNAMRREGPPPVIDETFSEEDAEHMRRVAVRMTRHAVERDPLYRNGVFATQELVPLLGFTDAEVRTDDLQRQLDLFRSKS